MSTFLMSSAAYGLRITDYGLFVSEDGTDWAPQPALAVEAGSWPLNDNSLGGPVTARYARVVQPGTANAWWSIVELNLYV